jgi:hypothetical protein
MDGGTRPAGSQRRSARDDDFPRQRRIARAQGHPRRRGLDGIRAIEHAVARFQERRGPGPAKADRGAGRGRRGKAAGDPRDEGGRLLRLSAAHRARRRRVACGGRRHERRRLRFRLSSPPRAGRARRHPQLLVQPDRDPGVDPARGLRRRHRRLHQGDPSESPRVRSRHPGAQGGMGEVLSGN